MEHTQVTIIKGVAFVFNLKKVNFQRCRKDDVTVSSFYKSKNIF